MFTAIGVVQSRRDNNAEHDRWQVLTVADGRIADILGYDDAASAATAAGIAD